MRKLFYFLVSVLCFTACGDDPLADLTADSIDADLEVSLVKKYTFNVTAKHDPKYMNVMDFHVDYASGHVDAAHDSVVKQAIIYGGYMPNSDSTEFSTSYLTYYIHPKGDTLYHYSDHIENNIDVVFVSDGTVDPLPPLKGLTYRADSYGGSKNNPYMLTLDCDRIWPEYDDAIHEVLIKNGWVLDREGQNLYCRYTHEHLSDEVYQVGDFYIEVNFYYR